MSHDERHSEPFANILRQARQDTAEGLPATRLQTLHRQLREQMGPAAEHKQARWRWPAVGFVAVGMASAAIALVVWVPQSTPPPAALAQPTAQLVMSIGDVRVSVGSADVSVLRGENLPAASRLHLGAGARADLRLGQVRTAFMGPATVRLDDIHAPVVEDGTATFSVPPRPPGMPFRVRVGGSTVTVVGTLFRVESASGHLLAVQVAEGMVEVSKSPSGEGRSPLRLGAGQYLGEVPARPPDVELPPVFETPWWGYVVPREREVAQAQPEKRLAPRPGAPPSDAWKQAQAALVAQRCAAVDVAVRKIVKASRNDDERVRASMLSAECRMQVGDRRRALQTYQGILKAYGQEPSSESALFESANLLAALGRTKQSLVELERYLSRYPSGEYVANATFRRCELLVGERRLDEARACLEDHRQRFASHYRHADAALLLATIAGMQERWADCVAACRTFLAEAPQSKRAVEASYNLVVCLNRGKLPGLVEAARNHLDRYPDSSHADEIRAILPR